MKKHTLFKTAAFIAVLMAGFLFAQDTSSPSGTDWDDQTALNNPQFYLQKAREYYKTAQDKYAEGDYDTSADYARKARDAAENYRKAIKIASQYALAAARIREAEDLIATAKSMNATPEDLAPSVDKLNEAKGYNDAKNYDLAVNSAEESINLTKDLINRLKGKAVSTTNGSKYWKTYKVRLIPERRDCLWRIAEYDTIYNDPFKWPMIYSENKDQIIDPDLIYPGQIFRIPFLTKGTNKNPGTTEKK
jgi:nucleoid-associated protein YgaU